MNSGEQEEPDSQEKSELLQLGKSSHMEEKPSFKYFFPAVKGSAGEQDCRRVRGCID